MKPVRLEKEEHPGGVSWFDLTGVCRVRPGEEFWMWGPAGATRGSPEEYGTLQVATLVNAQAGRPWIAWFTAAAAASPDRQPELEPCLPPTRRPDGLRYVVEPTAKEQPAPEMDQEWAAVGWAMLAVLTGESSAAGAARSPDRRLRSAAARALAARAGEPEADAELRRLLDPGDPDVAGDAADALLERHEPAAVRLVLEAIGRGDRGNHLDDAVALEMLGGWRELTAVTRSLADDPSEHVSAGVAEVLRYT